MKKILSFVGSALYGILFSYLLWLFFYLVIPHLVILSWIWLVVFFFFYLTITGLVVSFGRFLYIPLYFLSRGSIIYKIIPALALVFYGYALIILPWHLSLNGLLQHIWAVLIDLNIATFFITFIALVFKNFENNN